MPIDSEQLTIAVRQRLTERSFDHCVRVAESSSALAKSYGIDEEQAWAAGLLHDWDRELTGPDLVEAARTAGVPVTHVDERVPYLLHARTAAVHVAERFPELPSVVIDAIARHTVGAPDMTPLDMVVFVADMIEPARDWPGVDELRREAASTPLPAVFFDSYRRSLMHLIEVGKAIHPDTLDVWNSLVAGGAR